MAKLFSHKRAWTAGGESGRFWDRASRKRTADALSSSIFPCLPRGAALCYLGNRGEKFGIARRGMSKPSDLVQGTLDLLLLKIVALEPMNGWSISLRLRQISGDVLQVSDGSLYPALHKLEQEGWITAEWRPSENNRRAKFYSLTRPGRKQLEKEAANWDRLAGAITQIVKLKEA